LVKAFEKKNKFAAFSVQKVI